LLTPNSVHPPLTVLLANSAQSGGPKPCTSITEIVGPDVGIAAGAVRDCGSARADQRSHRRNRRTRQVPLQLSEPLKSWVLDPDLENSGRWIRVFVNAALDTIRGGVPRPRPRGSPRLLRRRSLRRVDAATYAATPRSCLSSPSSCRRSRPLWRSTDGVTVSSRSRTQSSSTSDCRIVVSRSSIPATSSGISSVVAGWFERCAGRALAANR